MAEESDKKNKAWEKAYDIIHEKILKMEIKPGESVTEISLSKRLGIGRTPVREALKRLEQEGLIVTSNRRKRVFVLTIDEIEEIFDLKKTIESSVLKWAIERGREEDFTHLRQTFDDMKNLLREKPDNSHEEDSWFPRWLAKDEELHELLLNMANNRRAKQIITNLNNQWHRLRLGILAMEGRIEQSLKEHERFVVAVLNRDHDEAENAMKIHLENLENIIVRLMKIFHYPATQMGINGKRNQN